jgi:hypothetical protein
MPIEEKETKPVEEENKEEVLRLRDQDPPFINTNSILMPKF